MSNRNKRNNNDDGTQDSKKELAFIFIVPILALSFLPITGSTPTAPSPHVDTSGIANCAITNTNRASTGGGINATQITGIYQISIVFSWSDSMTLKDDAFVIYRLTSGSLPACNSAASGQFCGSEWHITSATQGSSESTTTIVCGLNDTVHQWVFFYLVARVSLGSTSTVTIDNQQITIIEF
jgi:hypothetical protein